ncbi:hypothetical protein [Parasitella parasitica]|uniref:Tc1-like transposase DDE domain-containing protein n=1 Tax=Parasitella parasitica TaxID=35722 RepID=A0A0B7NPI4_9FUNG|nr:hypothetical protein [Parasitella parasitica]
MLETTKITCCERAYILGLNKGGMDVDQVAKEVNRSVFGIYKIVKKRRPPKLTERGEILIVNYARKNRRVTLGEITNASVNNVSKATVRRTLHEVELSKNEALSQSGVIWTDETSFCVGEEHQTSPSREIPPKMMVWGTISYGKKSKLVFLEKDKRSAPDFVDQNGAPLQKSKVPKNWREEHGINKMIWPAQSPDLKPIENLWTQMKSFIQKKRRSSTDIGTFKKVIQEAWDEIDVQKIIRLTDSMPKRVRALVKLLDGNCT